MNLSHIQRESILWTCNSGSNSLSESQSYLAQPVLAASSLAHATAGETQILEAFLTSLDY